MEITAQDFQHLLNLVKEGHIILVSDTSLDLPTNHAIPGTEHIGYGCFNAVTEDFSIQFDGGGGLDRTPNGLGYTYVTVVSGTFPYNRERVIARLEYLIEYYGG